jgi:hypothetical protein
MPKENKEANTLSSIPSIGINLVVASSQEGILLVEGEQTYE